MYYLVIKTIISLPETPYVASPRDYLAHPNKPHEAVPHIFPVKEDAYLQIKKAREGMASG